MVLIGILPIFAGMKVIQIEIDDKLHRRFKVACAQNGESIKDAIIGMIKNDCQTTEKMQEDGNKKD